MLLADKISSILTDNKPESVAAAIKELYHNPEKFKALSSTASKTIVEKAGIVTIMEQEKHLIELFAGKESVSSKLNDLVNETSRTPRHD